MDTFAWRYCKYVRLATLPLISAKNNTLHSGCGFSWRSQTSIACRRADIDICADCIFSGQLSPAYTFATVKARPNTVDSLPPVSRFLPDLLSSLRGGRHQPIAAPGTGVQRYTHVCVIPSSWLIHLTCWLLPCSHTPASWSGEEGLCLPSRTCLRHAAHDGKTELLLPRLLKLHASVHPAESWDGEQRSATCTHAPLPLACLGRHCQEVTARPSRQQRA